MSNPKIIIDMTDLSLFDSIEECLVYNYVNHFSKDGQWRHTSYTRAQIANKVQVAEITVKVLLKTLLNKGALVKPKKAVYELSREFSLQFYINQPGNENQ